MTLEKRLVVFDNDAHCWAVVDEFDNFTCSFHTSREEAKKAIEMYEAGEIRPRRSAAEIAALARACRQ